MDALRKRGWKNTFKIESILQVSDLALENCDAVDDDDMSGKDFLDMENSETLKEQTSFHKS